MSVYEEIEYNKRFDLSLWKKLTAFLKPYRLYLGLIIFVMISVGAIDACFPLMTRYAIDNFVTPGKTEGLKAFAMGYVGLILLQVFNVWSFITLVGNLT